MSHGQNCDCGMCKVGKAMGMIKKAEKKTNQACSCGSGKEGANCCSSTQVSK